MSIDEQKLNSLQKYLTISYYLFKDFDKRKYTLAGNSSTGYQKLTLKCSIFLYRKKSL